MTILGIETSCDETGVAILKKTSDDSIRILSNVVASSLALHAKTGGVIPEVAAREQIKVILPTLKEALKEGLSFELEEKNIPQIEAIAVTYGPGLIGSLLVGVETAKTLSLLWNKPLIPVNHMHGHLYVNWIENHDITFPALALIVSGGHTDLLFMKNKHEITVVGGTRDDAAGEAFDKIGRLLNLSYPAGATIAKLAEKGNPKSFQLPRPMLGAENYEFSFSGLKTSVLNLVKKHDWDFTNAKFLDENPHLLPDLCASVQQAIVDVLAKKTLQAATEYGVTSLLLGGGVAANTALRQRLKADGETLGITLFSPTPQLCTDNGAMIAAAGFFTPSAKSSQEVNADPQLYY